MTRVLLGAAEQRVVVELREVLGDVDEVESVQNAESTEEVSAVAGRERPDIVVVHDLLGPQATEEVVRDVSFRSPTSGVIVVRSDSSADGAIALMEAGAKAVVAFPISAREFAEKFERTRQWSLRMGGLIAGGPDAGRGPGTRHGRLTVVTGAKGGVGATTIATHMAIDLHRKTSGAGRRVCLVDLDVLGGDVSGILEARQRVSLADVAKVSSDLDASTIMDAVVQHETGISLLLAPMNVPETDHVTPNAVRAVLALLRQEFSVVLVDGGSHPTPAQVAAVEMADEVLTVVTPDVLAMRSFRRVIQAWEGLGVRSEQDVHLLVNRSSREDVLTRDAISKLTSANLLRTTLPTAHRALERSVNARDPREMRETSWWSTLEKVGTEVGVVAPSSEPGDPTEQRPDEQDGRPVPTASRGRRRSARSDRPARVAKEAGQVSVETVALVPLVILVSLMVWQLALTGLAFVWNGNAANAAARASGIGSDPEVAARDAMPQSMQDTVTVSVLSDGSVRVSSAIPVMCPGCAALPDRITQTATAVEEP